MSIKALKQKNLVEKISEYKTIKRFQLRKLISSTLNVRDRHSITSWINWLEAMEIIEVKGKSAYISKRENKDCYSFISNEVDKNLLLNKYMPNNETEYIIKINKEIIEEYKKENYTPIKEIVISK